MSSDTVEHSHQCFPVCQLCLMAINALVQELCREEEVGFVDLCGCFVGRTDMFMRDRLHPSGKGAAVFADELLGTVDIGMGSIKKAQEVT